MWKRCVKIQIWQAPRSEFELHKILMNIHWKVEETSTTIWLIGRFWLVRKIQIDPKNYLQVCGFIMAALKYLYVSSNTRPGEVETGILANIQVSSDFFYYYFSIFIWWGVTKCAQWWDERQKINYKANNDRNLTKLTTHCLDLYQNEVWQFFRPHLPPIMVKKCPMYWKWGCFLVRSKK